MWSCFLYREKATTVVLANFTNFLQLLECFSDCDRVYVFLISCYSSVVTTHQWLFHWICHLTEFHFLKCSKQHFEPVKISGVANNWNVPSCFEMPVPCLLVALKASTCRWKFFCARRQVLVFTKNTGTWLILNNTKVTMCFSRLRCRVMLLCLLSLKTTSRIRNFWCRRGTQIKTVVHVEKTVYCISSSFETKTLRCFRISTLAV